MKPGIMILLAGLMLICACAPYQGSPSGISTNGALNLVVTSTGYSWVTMRYNEITGETWFQVPYLWHTIGEEKKLSDSWYIVRMIGFGENQWAAIRLDTRSGRCWIMNDFYWIETTDNLSPESTEGPFNLEMVSTGSDWDAIWYNESTGESWWRFPGHWRPVKESEIGPNSRYLVRMAGEEDWGWIAIRMDARTGRCWMIEEMDGDLQWVEMEMTVTPNK
jgi:hypothetical protein